MPWYAVRVIYHFGVKSDGTNVFEERVVCFEASDWPEAHQKAEKESEDYATANNMTAHHEFNGYEQDGAPLIDGYMRPTLKHTTMRRCTRTGVCQFVT